MLRDFRTRSLAASGGRSCCFYKNAKLNTDYIPGMAKMEGGVKILLDIDRVLKADEIELLERAV